MLIQEKKGMTKVALYARYSDDKQSSASIEDQFRICREHAARERWEVIGTYKDAAISGASVILRQGVQTLLQDAQQGKFEVVLAEALDRVSRDQADVATLFKHLRFAGVRIVTLSEGEISELHVGLKGTMNALFLKDLAAKTHRGLRGRVEKGKAGGGLCYGYRVVKKLDASGEPIRGEREIVPEEANIVRRIFREFAAGRSPIAIATDLNRDGIGGPFGRPWGDTTIRGHVSRGNGLVNNELYIGILVWNRQRFIKDPNTGKRVSRANPETEWIRTDVPAQRIIDDALWQSVKNRQAVLTKLFERTTMAVREARAKRMYHAHRPAYLLSGLLTCGVCDGRYGIVAAERYGCRNHFRRGTCDNGRTIARDQIERRILSGLREKLVSPDSVASAARAYFEIWNRENHERRAQGAVDRQMLGKIERSIQGLLKAIEDGMYQPAMKARMDELELQKAEIEARLREVPADLPDINPNTAERYRKQIIHLTGLLEDSEFSHEAAADIRSLIGEIILTPGDKRGEVHAVLNGEFMQILDFAAGRRLIPFSSKVIPSVLAGPRNQPPSPIAALSGSARAIGSGARLEALRPGILCTKSCPRVE